MAEKFCVSLSFAKDNADKATVGFVVANAAAASNRTSFWPALTGTERVISA